MRINDITGYLIYPEHPTEVYVVLSNEQIHCKAVHQGQAHRMRLRLRLSKQVMSTCIRGGGGYKGYRSDQSAIAMYRVDRSTSLVPSHGTGNSQGRFPVACLAVLGIVRSEGYSLSDGMCARCIRDGPRR